jgi:acyl-CoA thioesterase
MIGKLKSYFAHDRYAALTGIELLDVDRGFARAALTVNDSHLNAENLLHGGVLFTLADFVFAAASNSHGTVALSISSNISFFKAMRTGRITAEGKEVSLHARLATYEVHVTDQEGDLVALFTGTVYRKRDSLTEHPDGSG